MSRFRSGRSALARSGEPDGKRSVIASPRQDENEAKDEAARAHQAVAERGQAAHGRGPPARDLAPGRQRDADAEQHRPRKDQGRHEDEGAVRHSAASRNEVCARASGSNFAVSSPWAIQPGRSWRANSSSRRRSPA